jgi:hypothetical protein
MNEFEAIRTPQQIIEEFAEQATSICSGRHAREDSRSKIGGEAKTKYPRETNAITRGLGHSMWACTAGRNP